MTIIAELLLDDFCLPFVVAAFILRRRYEKTPHAIFNMLREYAGQRPGGTSTPIRSCCSCWCLWCMLRICLSVCVV